VLILYAAMKYDYGKPAQGFGFEHYNFYDSLRNLGHDLLYFDFVSLAQKLGRRWMNRRLLEVARSERPALLFTVAGNEFDQDVFRQISRSGTTITLNWFCDDHWRFEDFSRHWAPCFNWIVTTSTAAVPKYAAIGYTSVIKSQWGCNHHLYRKLDLPLRYDVTFVGQPHGERRETIARLREAGLRVNVWGSRWESGRLSQEEMIRVFNQSRINLNLSDAGQPFLTPFGKFVVSVPGLHPAGVRLKAMIRRRLPRHEPAVGKPGGRSSLRFTKQIKGRNFEVPGCGGFVLTGHAENLDEYFVPGREIVCYQDEEELIRLARYYLDHEEERAAIAQAGYQRTLREHTYDHRFREIFGVMGLPWRAESSCGQTREID
jgi:spore maturation protein CgeB